MRKSILILICLMCASPVLAQEHYARMSAPMLGAGAAAVGGGCDPVSLFDRSALSSVGAEAVDYYATKFTVDSGSSVTGYYYSGIQHTTATDVISCVYADDGGTPSKPTGGCIAGTSHQDHPPDSSGALTVTLDAAQTLGVGTTFWQVAEAVTKGGTYLRLTYGNNSGDRMCESDDGATWICFANDAFRVKVLGCGP